MRLTALLTLLPLAVYAQTKPEDQASLEGQVFDAASGGALRKASVVLRPVDAPAEPGFTSTDDAGKFAMKDLEPGRYRLTVSHTGYVNGEYGARGPGRQGETIDLARAQKLTGLTVKLTPQGVISGRIVDRDGDPVDGVLVQILRYQYGQGRRQLQAGSAATTNDLGEYRIAGVSPGKYYVSATYLGNPVLRQTVDRSANGPPGQNFAPTYYPGTLDVSTASELTILAGAQISADLTLEKARTARISGRVVGTVGDPRGSPTVVLDSRGPVNVSGVNKSTSAGAGGKFELRGVVPGSYYLVAMENVGGRNHSTRVPIEVRESDLEDETLTIGLALELNGHVRIDGDSALSLTGVRLALQPREPGVFGGPLPDVSPAQDGTFHMEQINPDVYDVSVRGLPQGFYIKSIKSGDTDVLANGLDLVNGAPGDVDVVLSPKAGQVTGLVQDPQTNQPVTGATLVLIPADKERRDRQRDYRVATTDQSGGFNLTSVVPGEYQVYAWDDIEAGAYFDPDFINPFESKTQKIVVRENDQLMLQIPVIPTSQ